MPGKRVLAMVLAGGEGSRLHPLTAERCKPAVPFNGRHRVVDFVLSNLVNSELYSIYLLVQYKSQSLIEHIRQSWPMAQFMPDHFITVVPPQMRDGANWFQGTADSVHQNIHLIESFRPDLVAVFGADHVYRMDVRQMIDFHLANQAHVSVATLPVPLEKSKSFGIVQIDARSRIRRFIEKPERCDPMPGSSTHALASMGNYIFNTEVLLECLKQAHEDGHHDFGRHILPAILHSHRLVAYDFNSNVVPGIGPYEEQGYWRDVGTIDAYFEAHFDTLGKEPRFSMTNRDWPIYASPDQAESARIENGVIRRSIVGSGCVVDGAELDHAMLRRAVVVEQEARLEHCIIMERSRIGRGAQIRRAIVDQNNDIPPGERIGLDPEEDRRRFSVSEKGVVVVPSGFFPRRADPPAGRVRASYTVSAETAASAGIPLAAL